MNVILKYNKDTPRSRACLKRWLTIFRDYPTTIITDINADYTDIDISHCMIVNSDPRCDDTNCYGIDTRYKGHTVANLTGYKIALDSFWLIDADDTMLLADIDSLRDKFKKAEYYFMDNKLDGFSLDFYREKCDQWSFGVALLNKHVDLTMTKQITVNDVQDRGIEHNMDCVFDILRHRGVYKLESFVFDKTGFTHFIDHWEGAYYWQDNKNLDEPLAHGVVTIK